MTFATVFQIVYRYFDDFRETYHRDYSEKFGQLRDIVTHTVNRFLLCGDPREGITRYECPRCKASVSVTVSTRRQLLRLTPVEFLAKLTLHIPDRYQNIRRYAGFYASVIQSRVRKARGNGKPAAIDEGRPVKPRWAAMIAKIFGDMPIACPRCGTTIQEGVRLHYLLIDAGRIFGSYQGVWPANPASNFTERSSTSSRVAIRSAAHS